jgi:hypothetical protein
VYHYWQTSTGAPALRHSYTATQCVTCWSWKNLKITLRTSGKCHLLRQFDGLISPLVIISLISSRRPQLLVLTGPPSSRPDLIHFMSHVSREVGVMICGQVLVVSSCHLRCHYLHF